MNIRNPMDQSSFHLMSNSMTRPVSSISMTPLANKLPQISILTEVFNKTTKLITVLMILLFYVISNEHYVSSSSETALAKTNQVLELTSDNFDLSTSKYQIVVLNFYAEWCPYSARWNPVFQETAKLIYNETLEHDPNTIVFGRINCEVQTTLAQRFRITKFPTTKVTLNGKPCKKEYRGARTATAFEEYIKKFLADPVVYAFTPTDISSKIEEKMGSVILYSGVLVERDDKAYESEELKTFRKVAQQLREDCQFVYVASGASGNKVSPPDLYSLMFKPHHKNLDTLIPYNGGNLLDSTALTAWAKENCVPLVREITFENAEELTEEGLPFVILFYDPKDKTWIEVFKKVVEQELIPETSGVKFLFADGHVFSHPLKHLGKTIKDLPLVAIDSFKHLFIYKHPITTISQPGYLKQFISDLHSGKLDREFHFGPDPVNPNSPTSPPESAFNKLAPSAYRYSLLMPRDEL